MATSLMRFRDFDIQEATINAIADIAIFKDRWTIVRAFYPGQPISFSWKFWDVWANSGILNFNGVNINAKVLLSNRVTSIYQSPNLNYTPGGGVGETVLELPVPVTWFYKIDNGRSIIVQVNVKGDIFEGSAEFAIIGENVYDWLKFLPLPSTEHLPGSRSATAIVAWKEAYTISAVFNNKSPYTRTNVSATLFENEVGSTNRRVAGATNFTVNSLGQLQVDFTNIKQEWQWLIPKIWIPKDSNFKMFEYHIELTINDDFNNVYSNVQFGPFPVNVRVSDKKQGLGYSATAAMAVAIILYALSWLITQGPGHTAQGIADGLGAAALDPPELDLKFKEEVPIRHKRVYSAFKGNKFFDSLGKFLDLSMRVAKASLTLSKIEGRILGAQEFKDPESLQLQKTTYNTVLQAMMNDASDLRESAEKAIQELNQLDTASWRKTNSVINGWIKKGLDLGFKQNATKAGIRKEDIQQITMALKEPVMVAQIKKGIAANLQEINSSLVKYAASSFDYGTGILNRKNYRKKKPKET